MLLTDPPFVDVNTNTAMKMIQNKIPPNMHMRASVRAAPGAYAALQRWIEPAYSPGVITPVSRAGIVLSNTPSPLAPAVTVITLGLPTFRGKANIAGGQR